LVQSTEPIHLHVALQLDPDFCLAPRLVSVSILALRRTCGAGGAACPAAKRKSPVGPVLRA
jgi:hypothetical protein